MGCIEKILNLPRGMGSFPRMQKLCEMLGHPERTFPTIHVAGTNGKGSVCTKIAAVLQKEGYRVGLYTSPHIDSFHERIQVDGEMISEEDLEALFTEVEQFPTTFFEMATLLAFLYFRKRGVDIAVIETGLGGRLDATNVVRPLVSVITTIGYDHTEILGHTLEAIAREKAGIIKEGVPVVIGPDVLVENCKSPLYQSSFRSDNYDLENREIARLALSLLPFPISERSLIEGLAIKPPCRFERIWVEKKEVIFDAAHNPQGTERLLQRLENVKQISFVVGFSKSKDIATCAKLIQRKAAAVYIVSSAHPRLATVEEIESAFSSQKTPIYLEESIAQGIENALLSPSEIVVITGSFFIMSDAKKIIEKKQNACYLSFLD